MNFGFNDEQELLRSTARKFLDNECSSEVVRRLMDGAEGMTPELWKKIAEQGWLGLIFPEAYGGMGLGFVDLTVLMEEMGRAVMPGPFFSTVLLGGLAVLEAGTEAQKKAWLPEIASGDKRVTLAWMEPSRDARRRRDHAGGQVGAGGRLHAGRHQALRARRPHRRRHRGGGAHRLGPVAEDGVSLFLVPAGDARPRGQAPAHHGPDAQALRGDADRASRVGADALWARRAGLGAARARARPRHAWRSARRCAAARRRCST